MHIAKFTRNDNINLIIGHNERSMQRKNRENVDASLTHLNYNLLNTDKSGLKLFNEIYNNENVYCSPRKDVNVLCSVCVQLCDGIPIERADEFFYLAAKFFEDRYKCPCISCYVHKDEPNAKFHEHYVFVPIVYDEKKQRYKFRSKDIITKEDLKTLHPDFKRYIEKEMKLENVQVLNGATANGNKTILELKNQELEKKVASQQEEIEKLKQLKNKLQNQIEYELIR